MLLAEPISHTSTQYIDFFGFFHFTGFVYHLFILLVLMVVQLPLCVIHSLLECCVVFSEVKLSIRSFNLFL